MSEDDIDIFRIYLLQSFTIWEQAHARMLDGSMSQQEYEGWTELFLEYLTQGTVPEDIDYMLPWFQGQFGKEVEKLANSVAQ